MKFVLVLLCVCTAFSQRNIVKGTFKSNRLINFQTTEQPYKNTFEFIVGHRFGDTYSGVKDFFGLDFGASTYLGFDFGLTNSIQIGLGRLNFGKTYAFNGKMRLLRQRRKGGAPLSVSLYSVFNMRTQDNNEENLMLIQPLISHKLNKQFSVQLSPFFIQRFENTDRQIGAQSVYGFGLSGRVKVSKRTTLVAEGSFVLNRDEYNKNTIDNDKRELNTYSLAYNIEAAGHTFQVILSNTQEISTIRSLMGTNTDIGERHFYLGFNMTRLFTF